MGHNLPQTGIRANREAEIAATVHYTANDLRKRLGRQPTITEVIDAVEEWKRGRQPKVTRDAILRAVVNLGTRGWLTVDPDTTTADDVANMVVTGSLATLFPNPTRAIATWSASVG